jgi:hypothetical protein
MEITDLPYVPGAPSGRVGELVHHISADIRTIASDELELAKNELRQHSRAATGDAVVVLLSGVVALIGLGLLCSAAVAALGAVIPPLWLRLLIMAVVYLLAGGLVARAFALRFERDVVPDLSVPAEQARETIDHIKHGLSGERP